MPTWAFRVLAALLATGAMAGGATAQEAPRQGIQGRVVASANAGPIAGAAVVARREGDSTAVARAVSGADGGFQLPGLAPGRYVVRATHLGQTAASAPLTVGAAGMADAGDLRLGAVALAGLEVRAERPPVVHAEDRNVYSVKDMPVAGGVAADVMRTLPELEVDLDGTIRMVGNRPVTIHINNRPSPLRGEALTEFIRNLPADRIDRIEVIPNPSVRFEGGEAAIVNIVLRRDVQLGLSGSVALNAASRGGNGLSSQLAYQMGKLTLFGGGSSRLWKSDDESRERRQNLLATPLTWLDQDRRSTNRSAHGSMDLTAELSVGEKETVWASATGYLGGWGNEGSSRNQILDAELAPLRTYDRVTDSEADFRSHDLALGFRRIVEHQRHELSMEVRRNANGNDQHGSFEETPVSEAEGYDPLFELRTTANESNETRLTAKVDYTHPLGPASRAEVGAYASRHEQAADQRLRVFDAPDAGVPAQSTANPFDYREDQRSAYANLSHKVGRVSLQGGLRAEATAQLLEQSVGDLPAFDRDYFAVFPSANVSVQLREGVDLRLNYSERVRRPWIFDVNPYVQQTDPRSVRFGNPDLQPAETRSVGFDVSWRARLLTLRLAPYYRRTDHEIEYIRTVDSAGVSTTVPRNLASVLNYGTTLNASLRAGGWGNLSATMGASRDERDAGELGAVYSRNSSNRFFSMNANLQPGRGVTVQGSLRISSPRETAQGRFSSTAYTQLGVRKELFKGKSSLDVRVTDPLDIYRSTFQSRDPSFNVSGQSRNSFATRSMSVSFTYRFGRPPQRKSTPGEQEPAAVPGPTQ